MSHLVLIKVFVRYFKNDSNKNRKTGFFNLLQDQVFKRETVF